MKSGIRIDKICEFCGKDFVAQTTLTKFCGSICSKSAYKSRMKNEGTESRELLAIEKRNKRLERIKKQEFLSVRDLATVLNCSVRTIYNYLANGQIQAVNLGERMTRIKRSQVDVLFDNRTEQQPTAIEPTEIKVSDCYALYEVMQKYGISQDGLQKIIKRNNIPKIRDGRFAYIPKAMIDKILH